MDFDLFLFTRDASLVSAADDGGVDGFVVDWERRGKAGRQAGADTEVNGERPRDLARVRAATERSVICRINPVGPWSEAEVDRALEGGADELLVPMVEAPEDVERVLTLAAGRAEVGILVETEEAVTRANELARLPISRVFLGLNDLAIQRGSASIFDAVADGTVEAVRGAFPVPFGFAGLTLPDRGAPIPCRLLMAEMDRLGCSFAFMRRSYLRDLPAQGGHREAVAAIRAALKSIEQRSPAERELDSRRLRDAIEAASGVQIPG